MHFPRVKYESTVKNTHKGSYEISTYTPTFSDVGLRHMRDIARFTPMGSLGYHWLCNSIYHYKFFIE